MLGAFQVGLCELVLTNLGWAVVRDKPVLIQAQCLLLADGLRFHSNPSSLQKENEEPLWQMMSKVRTPESLMPEAGILRWLGRGAVAS